LPIARQGRTAMIRTIWMVRTGRPCRDF
jgi:hypothetical protein